MSKTYIRVHSVKGDGNCGLHSLRFFLTSLGIKSSIKGLRETLARWRSVDILPSLNEQYRGHQSLPANPSPDDVYRIVSSSQFWLSSSDLVYMCSQFGLFPLILVRRDFVEPGKSNLNVEDTEETCRFDSFPAQRIALEFRQNTEKYRVVLIEFFAGNHFQPLVLEPGPHVLTYEQLPSQFRREFESCKLLEGPVLTVVDDPDVSNLLLATVCAPPTQRWLTALEDETQFERQTDARAASGSGSIFFERQGSSAQLLKNTFLDPSSYFTIKSSPTAVVLRLLCVKPRRPYMLVNDVLLWIYDHRTTETEVQLCVPYSKARVFIDVLGFWPLGFPPRDASVDDLDRLWPRDELPGEAVLRRLDQFGLLAERFENRDAPATAEVAERGGVILYRKLFGGPS